MKRKVIAFCGFEQSGKDYSCKRLMTTKGFKKVAFADALREVAFKTLGMSFDEGMEKYEELKRTELYNSLNFRNILENLGSAIRRFDKDFCLQLLWECFAVWGGILLCYTERSRKKEIRRKWKK